MVAQHENLDLALGARQQKKEELNFEPLPDYE
jgi:hypothetical protein